MVSIGGQLLGELRLLELYTQALAQVVIMPGAPPVTEHVHRPLVRRGESFEDLDGRRLAGPIRAQQSEALTRPHRKVDPRDRHQVFISLHQAGAANRHGGTVSPAGSGARPRLHLHRYPKDHRWRPASPHRRRHSLCNLQSIPEPPAAARTRSFGSNGSFECNLRHRLCRLACPPVPHILPASYTCRRTRRAAVSTVGPADGRRGPTRGTGRRTACSHQKECGPAAPRALPS